MIRRNRTDIRITNIQAVDVRLSDAGFMDTSRTYYYEDEASTFVRVVRVAYVQLAGELQNSNAELIFSPS